jgi:hypothetical protein
MLGVKSMRLVLNGRNRLKYYSLEGSFRSAFALTENHSGLDLCKKFAARRKRLKSEKCQGTENNLKALIAFACLGMASHSPQFPGLQACKNGCKSVLHIRRE